MLKVGTALLFIPTLAFLAVTLSAASALSEPAAYQVTVRLIETGASVDTDSLKVPPMTVEATEEEFKQAFSELNPGVEFTLVQSIWAVVLAPGEVSFGAQQEQVALSVEVRLNPRNDPEEEAPGIRVGLHCQATIGGGSQMVSTNLLVQPGQGLLVAGSVRSDGARIFTLHVLPLETETEPPPE